MWEVDPETKSKLLALQKRPGNDRCCDCPAASPQWASPKFGTFICLECAGRHRGLGVHISFVRSITMDAFKGAEMARMDLGGNNAWRVFWEEKQGGKSGLKWEDISLEERYSGEVGEEWKERLACRVEGREFIAVPKPPRRAQATPKAAPAQTAPPGPGVASKRKEQNEAFFARMGDENANRSADIPPSQGGKYGGFGSGPAPSDAGRGEGAGEGGTLPGVDEFQKDPVAALTKGLGWFTTTVGRGAKTVNEGWIQPTAQKIAQSDLQTQARLTAASLAQNIQTGTKGAAEQFNKFIDGDNNTPSSSSAAPGTRAGTTGSRRAGGGGNAVVEPDRRDFWDSFGDNKAGGLMGGGGLAGSATKSGHRASGAIGTAAMKKGNHSTISTSSSSSTPGLAPTTTSTTTTHASGASKEDGWEDW